MINIGIIGMGRMGITHYAIINSYPDVVIDSVADPSSLVLTMLDKYLSLNTFKDYNDLLNNRKLDGLLVCTPPSLHYQIIKKAAEKRIPVFVEKPFTLKYSEASELNDLYRNLNLVNQVGYVNRFNDVFIKIKELIGLGLIGNIIRFKSEMFSNTITRTDESDGWRSTRENGGGAVFEMAAHAIDLVNFLVGKPDKVVGTSMNSIFSKNVEDSISSTFLYKSGMSGTIYVNWSDSSYRKPTNKFEVFGKGGRILADQHSLKIFLNAENKEHKLRSGWNTLYITDIFKPVPFYVRGNEFTRQLYHFVDCIKNNDLNSHCSFQDGVNTHEIIEKIFNDFNTNSI